MRSSLCVTVLIVLLWSAASRADPAPARDCGVEAKDLSKAQSELPKLEVASRLDRPPYCITLETVMAFASRVKAHVAHCPNSGFAAAAPEWAKTQQNYSRLFSLNRCRRTM